MNNIAISGAAAADELLHALSEQIAQEGGEYEVVVVGGAALLVLGLVDRATRDIDLVALVGEGGLESISPFPSMLSAARDRVARDFGLPPSWLNDGPASLLDLGLPDGFLDRAYRRRYGRSLSVLFASRFDQIHLKLYAAVDQGPGKHEADLRALAPTASELDAAARWARTHDPSPAFASELRAALRGFGVDGADLG